MADIVIFNELGKNFDDPLKWRAVQGKRSEEKPKDSLTWSLKTFTNGLSRLKNSLFRLFGY